MHNRTLKAYIVTSIIYISPVCVYTVGEAKPEIGEPGSVGSMRSTEDGGEGQAELPATSSGASSSSDGMLLDSEVSIVNH